jgi:RNA polymerase sigma-70 factor (ECF subfamily)
MGIPSDEPVPYAATRAEGRASLDLDRLYEEHADFVWRAVANLAGPHLEPEDLVQDVFVQACRSSQNFQGRASVRTWLYSLALGVVSNARRRARFRRFLGLEEARDAAASDPSAQDRVEKEQTRRLVHAVLEKLPEKKRAVLILFELEGLRGEQIAEVMGCPLATVWSRLYHARQEFARQLERHERAERERAGSRP